MTPALEPDLLRAFVAVAEHRSFTRAAVALHRTQSAASTQIKRLEDQLGVPLFHRSTAHVELTPAGERLLGYARQLLALNDEAIGRVRQHTIEGVVRLGVMDDYGSIIVPPILARFASGHPQIEIRMETGLTARMIDRIGRDFDIVIAMHLHGHREGEFLRREQPLWAAAPVHPIELADPLPVALYPQGCLFRQWAIEALNKTKRRWRLAFVSHSLAAVEAIVVQGLAVTIFKSGTFPASLRKLAVKDGMPRLPAADIRLHRASRLSPAGALLADHLVETIRGGAGLGS
jgi:DNA-binding transcriptional LysR family regulator